MVTASVNEPDLEKTFEINVTVKTPKNCRGRDGSIFTTYAIYLESDHPCFLKTFSIQRRRYSEFVCLRKLLSIQHPIVIPPALPPKHFFYRFDPEFIEQRRAGLESFLQKVLDIPVYLSNTSVHKFVQSNTRMRDIASAARHKIPLPKLNSETTIQLSSWSSQESLCDPNESANNSSTIEFSAVECTEDIDLENLESKLDCPLQSVLSDIRVPLQEPNMDLSCCDEIDSKTPVPECPLLHPDLLKLKNSAPIPCKNILRKSSLSGSQNSPCESDLSSSGSPPDPSNVKKVSFCRKITVARVNEANWQIAIKPIKDVK